MLIKKRLNLVIIIFCAIYSFSNRSFGGEYHGDVGSFVTFKNKYSLNWPTPEKIDYFDPSNKNEDVIRYAHWTPQSGNTVGTVVHFNGRTEFIEKNIYTYIDLINRGFEVWTFDWRGQGFSQRQISGDKQKHDIDDFNTYITDAKYFIDNVIRLDEKRGKKVLLAHSMGGQIALRYLLDFPRVFDYAVLSSPLLRLPGDKAISETISANLLRGLNDTKLKAGYRQTCAGLNEIQLERSGTDGNFTNKIKNFFSSSNNSDFLQKKLQEPIKSFNTMVKQTPGLETLYQSNAWSSYFINNNSCELIGSNPITDTELDPKAGTKNYSNDLEKIAEIDCLIKSSIDANGLEKPDLRLACVTDKWLSEAIKSTDIVLNNQFNKLKTPTLIIRAFPDIAVDNKGQTEFCNKSEYCKSLIGITKVDGVQVGHELMIETQPVRKLFFELFDDFVRMDTQN